MKVLKKILKYKYTYIIIFVVVLIIALLRINYDNKKDKYNLGEKQFILRIVDIKYKNDLYRVEFLGKERLISNSKDFKYDIGDIVIVNGSLKKIDKNAIPNLFDYQNYYKSRNIYHELLINEVSLKSRDKSIFTKIDKEIKKRIRKIDNDYIYTFIQGDTSYIDSTTRKSLQLNGLQHIMSIGSFEIMAIIFVMNKIRKKYNISENKYLFILGIIFFLYLVLTNFKIGILRSSICCLISKIIKYHKIKIKYSNIILITASLLLLIYPNYLYNIGFFYSFIISFGLSFIKRTKSKILNIFKYSLFANIFSFPLNIYFNYDINILSILLNVIFLPVINFIFFPLSILCFLLPFLNDLFSFIIIIFENLLHFFSQITIFHLLFRKPSIIVIVLYYLLIVVSFQYKKARILIIIILLVHLNINSILNEKLVTFLSVGQGDSILIKNNNNVTLIDTGGSTYKNISDDIRTYLNSLGIKKINSLIISHGDADHCGEAVNLVNNFKVEKVIFNCGSYNDLENELIKVLDKKKIKYYSCIKELNIDNSKLYFLQTKEYDNENDNSNVIYTELDGYKFMFMGDVSTTTEKEILSKYNLPDVDVLKVGHHGSRTSSGKDFINEINPKYSIISVGKNNRYGHPNKEVFNYLETKYIERIKMKVLCLKI